MKKVSLGQLLSALNELENIKNKEMPIVTAFKISKILKKYTSEKEAFAESVKQIIDKNAEKDDNGQPITAGNGFKIKAEKIDEVNQTMSALLSERVALRETDEELITYEELSEITVTPAFVDAAEIFIRRDHK